MPTLDPPPLPPGEHVDEEEPPEPSPSVQNAALRPVRTADFGDPGAKPSTRDMAPVRPSIPTAPGMPRVTPAMGMPAAWRDRESAPGEMHSTALGLGVPGPSFGGDTELDPLGAGAASTRRLNPIELDVPRDDGDLDLGLGIDDAAPDSNDALDLVGRRDETFGAATREDGSLVPPAPPPKADPMSELRERYALGDFSGALTIAEGLLEDQPNNADAQRYAESCRDVLRQMYAARLGPLDQVPVVAIPAEQLRWLTLDHRSGFLLSHVDGVSTLEEILDISGMNPLEAMRIIYDLLQQKVIALQ
jgi:hypothetical protein